MGNYTGRRVAQGDNRGNQNSVQRRKVEAILYQDFHVLR